MMIIIIILFVGINNVNQYIIKQQNYKQEMIENKTNSVPQKRRNSAAKNSRSPRNYPTRNASMHHRIINPNLNSQTIRANQPNTPVKPLTYYVGRGNNQDLIRKVLATRPIWVQSDDSTSAFVNLKWKQDQKGFRYQRLVQNYQYRAIVNHMQFHENLSNKQFLFRNIQKYCNKNDIDLWSIVPPSFILNSRDQCCMQSLKLFIDYYTKYFPKSLKQRRGTSEVDKEIYKERRKLRSFFFNSNLKKILPKNPPLENCYINKDEGDYLWIVKPTFLNRGRGIFVFSKLPDLSNYVSQNINGYVEKKHGEEVESENKKKPIVDYIRKNFESAKQAAVIKQMQSQIQRPSQDYREKQQNQQIFNGNQFIRVIPQGPSIIKTDCFLIQKYLESPLLIQNRKFDIRMWVLVAQNLKVYVFPEGYIRLSSFEYNCKDTKQSSFVHLTNNAIQKFSTDYGKLAQGNQMSFNDLKQIMKEKGLNYQIFREKTYEHITISMNSCIRKLNSLNRKYAFEIFGYDFMVDDTGHPWLIQVNTNPCLQQSSGILKKLLPRMLDDAFKLTIDQMFYGSYSTGNFEVPSYSKQNMWINLPIQS